MARAGKYRVAFSAMATALAVVLAACASSGDEDAGLADLEEVAAGPTEEKSSGEGPVEEEAPPEPPPEPAEETGDEDAPTDLSDIDITTVPDEITEDYVQAVLDELELILAEALVLMMEEGELTIDITDRVGDILASAQYLDRLDELVELAEAGFPGFRPADEIAPRTYEVVAILESTDECVYAEVVANEDGLFVEGPAPDTSFVLLRAPDFDRPVDINPTPWVYAALPIGDPDTLRGARPCAGN